MIRVEYDREPERGRAFAVSQGFGEVDVWAEHLEEGHWVRHEGDLLIHGSDEVMVDLALAIIQMASAGHAAIERLLQPIPEAKAVDIDDQWLPLGEVLRIVEKRRQQNRCSSIADKRGSNYWASRELEDCYLLRLLRQEFGDMEEAEDEST